MNGIKKITNGPNDMNHIIFLVMVSHKPIHMSTIPMSPINIT